MVRTQIYLTEAEQQSLRILSRHMGRTQSELVREAVDRFIAQAQTVNRLSLLKQGRGLWQNREDLPDWDSLRRELDRSTPDAQ